MKNWEKIQQNCALGWKPGEGNKKTLQSAGKIMRIGKVCKVCNSASKSNKNRHLGYNHYQCITLVVFVSNGLIHLIQVYPFNCPNCANPIWFALQAAKSRKAKQAGLFPNNNLGCDQC